MEKNQIELLSDNEIIEKIKISGSSIYFEVLYKRYHKKVLDKCYSLIKVRSIAEELAGDIFSKTFEKLPGYKQLSSFSSWLYSITYNHCIDYLREKKKLHYPSWNLENELLEIVDDNEESSDEINYDNFLQILELIHPEEKALLLMKYKDNLSIKQISSALRISDDAAKMRIKRARTRVIYLYHEKYLK